MIVTTGGNMDAITITNLNRIYPNGKQALKDLILEVKENEIFALLGENGSGKTTLLNILTTYHPYQHGSIRIFGNELKDHTAETRSMIACVAQHTSIEDHLTVVENLRFQSRLCKMNKETANRRIKQLVEDFGLQDYLNMPAAKFSGGIRRRLDIAMSMISCPKILFLDEPTTYLDVEARKKVWELLLKIKKDYGTTIILTSHYLEEVEYLCDTICIIKNGHKIMQSSIQDMRQQLQQHHIQIDLPNSDNLIEVLQQATFVTAYRHEKNGLMVSVTSDQDIQKVTELLLDLKIPFTGIQVHKTALEDIYVSITKGEHTYGN